MMTKTFTLAGLIAVATASAAGAQDYTQFPPLIPHQTVQHSHLTGRAVLIPPYPYPFPVRVYTTPPQPPYYNVPPYAVVAPY